jgi:imidazolonepropionase-like amidohydrolase
VHTDDNLLEVNVIKNQHKDKLNLGINHTRCLIMNKFKLLKCGKFFDGVKSEFEENIEILIEDDLIKEVGKNIEYPDGTEIIDLSHLQVTPGMIDAHVHPCFFDWKTLFTNYGQTSVEWDTLATLHSAQKSLERGFTTQRIMNFAVSGFGAVDVKRAIEEGYFKGSRLVVAANCLGATGGHIDFAAVLRNNPLIADTVTSQGVGSGPDFFRNAVRREIKYGSDFIKIIPTGGFCSPLDSPEEQQMSDDEIKAAIQTTLDLKRTVTAHVYSSDLIQKLVKFGISGIEHGSLMDKETAKMVEDSGVYCVPTFCAYEEIIRLNEENLAKKSIEYQLKLRNYQKQIIESRQIIIDSDIKLGYGSDYVVVHQNYESWHEYESWMLSGADPFRILKAATSVNADILNRNDIGVIEAGKKADISGWNRNLLTDPSALQECAFTMKNGTVYETVISD